MVATSLTKNKSYWEYGTGLAVEIPSHMVGLIFPRSSISNTCHFLLNSVGVIDSGYRGEIKLRLSKPSVSEKKDQDENVYSVGDRVGQLVTIECPFLKIVEVDSMEDSSRGLGGFGSSGK